MADELDFIASIDEAAFASALESMSGQLDALTEQMGALAESMSASLDAVVGSIDAMTLSIDSAAASFDVNSTALDNNTAALEANAAAAADVGAAQEVASGNTKGLGSQFSALRLPILLASAAVVGLGVASVVMAGNFQQGMTSLVTGAGESEANLQLVSDGILNISESTATSTKSLLESMFVVESAGYHGAAGLKVLEIAAQGARVGSADLASEVDILTTALHNYSMSANRSTAVVNSLIQTVASGKMVMDDLNQSLTNVLPTASKAGVALTDVEGALATMAASGDKGASAGTHLSQMLQSLENPSSKATKMLKVVNLTTQQIADEMKVSLPDTIQMIYDALAKKFPAGSAAFNAAAADIVGGNKQVKAWNELTGVSFQDLVGNTKAIKESFDNSGTAVTGWSKVQADFNFQIDQAKQGVLIFMTSIGTSLLPVVGQMVGDIMGKVMPALTQFSDWAKTHGKEMADDIKLVATAIGVGLVIALGAATVAFVAANLAAIGITAAVMGISLAVAFVILHWQQISHAVLSTAATIQHAFDIPAKIVVGLFNDIKSGVSRAIATVKADFLGSLNLIQTTTENVVNGTVAFWNKWQGVIKGTAAVLAVIFGPTLIMMGTQAAIAGAKIGITLVQQFYAAGTAAITSGAQMTANFVASMAKSATQAVVTGAVVTANFIKAMVQSGIEAVRTGAAMTVQLIPALLRTGAQFVVMAAQSIWAAIVAMAQFAAKGYVAAGAMLTSVVPAVVSTMGSFISMAATGIASAISGFIAYIPIALSAAAATLAATWPILAVIAALAFLAIGIKLAIEHWTQIKEAITHAVHVIASVVTAVFHAITSAFANLTGGAITSVTNLVSGIIGAVTGLPGQMLSIGESIVQGMITGIQNLAGKAVDTVKNLGSNLLNSAKSFFGIHSPSRLFADEVGSPIVQGMAVGILGAGSQAHSALQRVGNGLVGIGKSLAEPLQTNSMIGLSASAGRLSRGAGGGGHHEVHIHLEGGLGAGLQLLNAADRVRLVQQIGQEMTRQGMLHRNYGVGYTQN